MLFDENQQQFSLEGLPPLIEWTLISLPSVICVLILTIRCELLSNPFSPLIVLLCQWKFNYSVVPSEQKANGIELSAVGGSGDGCCEGEARNLGLLCCALFGK